jgi:hypothetical protein
MKTNRGNRDDRFSYAESGEFKLLEMQCEKCEHKSSSPMVCKKYADRKPDFILRAEAECPEFQPKR